MPRFLCTELHMKEGALMDKRLSYGDQCIIARNQNEIRDLEKIRNRLIKDIDEAVSDLRKQNREILGRE